MTEVINLKQQRKAKARTDKEKKAAQNRAVFGRTKAEKLKETKDAERIAKLLDGHKREPGEE